MEAFNASHWVPLGHIASLRDNKLYGMNRICIKKVLVFIGQGAVLVLPRGIISMMIERALKVAEPRNHQPNTDMVKKVYFKLFNLGFLL